MDMWMIVDVTPTGFGIYRTVGAIIISPLRGFGGGFETTPSIIPPPKASFVQVVAAF